MAVITNKIAFIWGDGAIKGGFMAGAADVSLRLVQEQGAEICAIMASSASVGNVLYFLSFGYDHPGREMWTQTLCDPSFLKYDGLKSLYSERPVYDINFLVDKIFREKYPLDINRIRNSDIKIFFPLQDYDSGELVYFTNSDVREFSRGDERISVRNMFDFDIYELIRAASAAPFVFDRHVELGGRRYIDAATIEPFAMDLPIIRDHKKILILSKRDSGLKRFVSYLGLALFFVICVRPFKSTRLKIRHYMQYPMKALLMHRLLKAAHSQCDRGEAVMLAPNKAIGSNFDNSKKTLLDNYMHGVAVAEGAHDTIVKLIAGK